MADDETVGLGVHVLKGETLLHLLRRVHEGEHPDEVYMEMYANALHVKNLRLEGDE